MLMVPSLIGPRRVLDHLLEMEMMVKLAKGRSKSGGGGEEKDDRRMSDVIARVSLVLQQ